MPIERRTVQGVKAFHQRIVVDETFITTDATPQALYTSVIVLPEKSRTVLRANVLISEPSAANVVSILVEATVARAIGGTLRIVKDTFTRAGTEINSNHASVSIVINAGRFVITATGKIGFTYEWNIELEVFRNA